MKTTIEINHTKTTIQGAHTFSVFLSHLKKMISDMHGLHHPFTQILSSLLEIEKEPDRLRDNIRLGHEITIRTFEEIFSRNHHSVLQMWSRYLKNYDNKRPHASPFFTTLDRAIENSRSSTSLPDGIRLSLLYEHTFASHYHSDDQELRVQLAGELMRRASAMRPATAQPQYDLVSRSIYLAASILEAHYNFIRDTARLPNVVDAIGWLQQGDTECRVRAAGLSKKLAGTYKKCGLLAECSAEYKRAARIGSSIPGIGPWFLRHRLRGLAKASSERLHSLEKVISLLNGEILVLILMGNADAR